MGLGRSLLLQPGPAAGLRTLQAASDLARRRLTIIAAAAWRSDARSSPAEGSAHTAAAAGRAATAAPLAAPGSSAALAAAGSAAPADAHAPLGTDDLRRFIEQHGIAAAVVPPLNGALPPAPDCCEVKSLLFLADGQPLVLVLPLEARVDERALAALLHTGRNRVRLAPLDSLVPLCGYTGALHAVALHCCRLIIAP